MLRLFDIGMVIARYVRDDLKRSTIHRADVKQTVRRLSDQGVIRHGVIACAFSKTSRKLRENPECIVCARV